MRELHWINEEKTWHYVLDISMGPTKRWQILKRYSEIRDFWEQLCTFLQHHDSSIEDDNSNKQCTERKHFLAGIEQDKFPKKKMFHSRNVLEIRANKLQDFFQRLCMRLNLCNQKQIHECQLFGCQLLELIGNFFQVSRVNNRLTTCRSHTTTNTGRTCSTRSRSRRKSIHSSLRDGPRSLKSYQSLILRRNSTTCGKKRSSIGRLSLSSLDECLLH
jgi:hypothetical protein